MKDKNNLASLAALGIILAAVIGLIVTSYLIGEMGLTPREAGML